MVKILSQSGISLADAYDVEGSIAGIDQLESREVQLVHEMGATLFAERYSTEIRRISSGAVAQNLAFNNIIADLPVAAFRILGVTVFVDATGRTAHASVSVRDPTAPGTVPPLIGRETPIWAWDTAGDGDMNIQNEPNGGGVGTEIFHAPIVFQPVYPITIAGTAQPQSTPEIALRGLTSGFGAGTVINTALILIAFAESGGRSLSSYGLPIPNW